MNFSNLTAEEKEKLKEYAESIKAIKKEINMLLEKSGCRLREDEDSSHNMSSGLVKTLETKHMKKQIKLIGYVNE